MTDVPEITLPPVDMGEPPAPDDPTANFNLAVGGALDLGNMDTSIAPLDQASAMRVGNHSPLDPPSVLAPTDKLPEPQTDLQLSPDIRSAYSQALQNGETDGPLDFAERLSGIGWDVATDGAGGDATQAAQVTNAAASMASALPKHEDLIDYSIGLSHETFGQATPGTVALVKSSLLDAWQQTGRPIQDIVRDAMQDSDLAWQLSTAPRAAPTAAAYPVMKPGADAISSVLDPIKMIAAIPDAVKGVINLPGEQYDYRQKIEAMRAEKDETGLPKYSPEEIHQQEMLNPSINLLASIVAGRVLGTTASGISTVARDSRVADVMRALAGDESGELAPDRANRAANSILLDSVLGKSPLDDVIASTVEKNSLLNKVIEATNAEQKETMAAKIRYSTGQRNYVMSLAKDALEGYYQAVNRELPGYADWIKQFQADNAATAQAKQAHIDAGGDPDQFKDYSPSGLTADYHPLQNFYDHIEQRPDGGRVVEGNPLYPLAETIRGLLDDRKEQLGKLSDTMGFWEDYYPHNWLDPKAAVAKSFPDAFGSGRQGSAYHLQERQLPTIFDGLQRGLTPRFLNPIEGALHYIEGIDNFVASENVRRWLVDQGHAYYATAPMNQGDTPLLGRASTKPERLIINGDKTTRLPEQRLYTAPGYAKIYNRWVGKGIEQWPAVGKLYEKVLMAKNATLGLTLGLSGFHPMVIMKEMIASHLANSLGAVRSGLLAEAARQVGFAALNLGTIGIFGGVRSARKGGRFDDVYLNKIENPTDLEQKLKAIYIKAGGAAPTSGRGEAYFSSQARNLFTSWSRSGAWGIESAVGRGVAAPVGMTAELLKSTSRDMYAAVVGQPGESAAKKAAWALPRLLGAVTESFGRVSDTLNAPLFDYMIPKVKRAVWADEMALYVKTHPKAEPEELLREGRRVMDSVDNRFGEMNMDNMFWQRWVKQVVQAAVVSQGWEYGTARMFGKGVADLIGRRRLTANSRTLMAYVLAMGLVNSAYQFVKTGTTPVETGAWNFAAPLTVAGNDYSAIETPGEEKEALRVYSLIKNAGTDPVKWIQGVEQYTVGKANPSLKDFIALFQAKNYQDWLNKVMDNSQPVIVANPHNNPAVDVGGFEQWLGIHGAPRAITGAPAAPRTHTTTAPKTRAYYPPPKPKRQR